MSETNIVVNIGPQHPSTHGAMRLKTTLRGDTVVNVEPDIGYLHRGVEKIAENRLYIQCVPAVNKLDYVAPMSWEALYVDTVERAMHAVVQPRAIVARTILVEIQRVMSHLLWLGDYSMNLGQPTLFLWCFRERDALMRVMEETTGSRMFHNYLRFGGFRSDLPPNFAELVSNAVACVESRLPEYWNFLEESAIFAARTQGIGVLTQDEVKLLGITGPMARASGLREDVRKQEPYLYYDKVRFDVPHDKAGDAFARYRVRFSEMAESISIIRQCLKALPEGEWKGSMAGRVLEKETFVRHELPRGEGAVYLVDNGKNMPYRLKLKSPCFSNLNALPYMVDGKNWKLADLIAIVGSIDFVMGEVDR